MVDQAQMNGRASRHHAGAALRENVTGLLHDVIELAELQTQLLRVDVEEAQRRSMMPIILILAGLVIALGTVPVLLMSIGWGLINGAGWGEGAAFALTALVGLIVAGGCAWIGWRKLTSAIGTLSRSKEEFTNNVRWMKNALKHRSSSA